MQILHHKRKLKDHLQNEKLMAAIVVMMASLSNCPTYDLDRLELTAAAEAGWSGVDPAMILLTFHHSALDLHHIDVILVEAGTIHQN